MLDLQPRVHLHEPEPVGAQAAASVHDEFDGAGAGIADRLGRAHGGLAHGGAHLGGHAGGRGFLDHLLVAALQGTVALEQMHGVGAVAEHLHLDMTRRGDVFLDQHGGVAKGGLGLALRRGQRGREIGRIVDAAHPLAAAAGHRLDEDGIADPVRLLRQKTRVLIVAVIARHHRHPGLFHQRLGRILEPHGPDRRRRGADEHQPRRGDRIDEFGVFRQEPIARVDRLRAAVQRRADDRVTAQIAVAGGRAADMDGLVGHGDMAGAAVGVGIDRDRVHPHAAAAVDDPAGDLAPVGDQDLAEHGVPFDCAAGPVVFHPIVVYDDPGGYFWTEDRMVTS